MKRIKVEAPAHLHAGNMDLNGELGRVYGTVGFTINCPRVVVKVERWHSVETNDPYAKRFKESSIPPLIYRGDIPEDWLFVVPTTLLEKNISFREVSEDKVLDEVYMDSSTVSHFSRLVLMKIIPGFIEKDIQEFGEAITELNRRLGFVRPKYQGSVYCSPIVGKGIEIIFKHTYGACQSSWGPTFYGVTDSEDKAEKLVDELNNFLRGHGGGEVFIARGRNKGLEVVEYG